MYAPRQRGVQSAATNNPAALRSTRAISGFAKLRYTFETKELWLYGCSGPKLGSIPSLRIEYGGHSDRATPEPIPNSEDKPVHVLYCTQVREPSGTTDRCHIHLKPFLNLTGTGLTNYCYLKPA